MGCGLFDSGLAYNSCASYTFIFYWIEIYFFSSTAGFASFLGTNSVRIPCSKACLDILFCDIFANIIASLTCACITLTSDVLACLLVFLLILIKTLCCTDGQVTIIQFSLNLVFLEARKINLKFIAICPVP